MIFERTIEKWRKILAGTLVLLGFMALASPAVAEVRIDITRGHLESLPIAISDFYGKEIRDGEIGADIAAVVSDNLERSGLFKPVNKGA
ncbi:MAG: Tol-Pal system protein TolB, partial [Pseudomonadota bacterium]|nr:Tol-Pal system protein TolB [Pseudomonadota bacterium]